MYKFYITCLHHQNLYPVLEMLLERVTESDPEQGAGAWRRKRILILCNPCTGAAYPVYPSGALYYFWATTLCHAGAAACRDTELQTV
jgi:hypothetical protein